MVIERVASGSVASPMNAPLPHFLADAGRATPRPAFFSCFVPVDYRTYIAKRDIRDFDGFPTDFY